MNLSKDYKKKKKLLKIVGNFIKVFLIMFFRDWEFKLMFFQDILDEWLKVQVIWFYLEFIFSFSDIMVQMLEEGRRFIIVDKNWKDIMKQVLQDKKVFSVIVIEKMLEKFKKFNELLEFIQKVGIYLFQEIYMEGIFLKFFSQKSWNIIVFCE